MYIKNLRFYRRKRELTVQQMADKLGVSRTAYNQIEQNCFTNNEAFGNAIIQILNIPTSCVFKITPKFLFNTSIPLASIQDVTNITGTDIEKYKKMHTSLLVPLKAEQATALLSYLNLL